MTLILTNFDKRNSDNSNNDKEIWICCGEKDYPNTLNMLSKYENGSPYRSALEELLNNKEKKERISKLYKLNEITIHFDKNPTLDAVFCYYFIRNYLEGTEPDFETFVCSLNKTVAEKICRYLKDIYLGINKNAVDPTLYGIYTVVDNEDDRTRVLRVGYKLVEIVINEIKKNNEFDIHNAKIDSINGICFDDLVYNAVKQIQNSKKIYDLEKSQGKLYFTELLVWTEKGKYESCNTAIWNEVPECENCYDHARKEGAVLTVVPRSIKGLNESDVTNVMVSLNIEKNDKGFVLQPLVEIIEQMEQIEEYYYFNQTEHFRRRRNSVRMGKEEETKIFKEAPFNVTNDPWYINSQNNMFYSPKSHSILDYEDILEVIKKQGDCVRQTEYITVEKKDQTVISNYYMGFDTLSISQWLNESKSFAQLSGDYLYKVIYSEMDWSLIPKNDLILKAYCMSVMEKSIFDINDQNFLHLDYGSYIYADSDIMIILSCNGNNKHSLLRKSDVMNQERQLCNAIIYPVQHRYQLLEFGHNLSRYLNTKGKDIEENNKKYMEFSTDLQNHNLSVMGDQRTIYSFLQNVFEIEKLSNSVLGQMQIVIDESRRRAVSGFDIITALAAPLVICEAIVSLLSYPLSTWFDFDTHKLDYRQIIFGMILLLISYLTAKLIKHRNEK